MDLLVDLGKGWDGSTGRANDFTFRSHHACLPKHNGLPRIYCVVVPATFAENMVKSRTAYIGYFPGLKGEEHLGGSGITHNILVSSDFQEFEAYDVC